jgi:hypothetical protein
MTCTISLEGCPLELVSEICTHISSLGFNIKTEVDIDSLSDTPLECLYAEDYNVFLEVTNVEK